MPGYYGVTSGEEVQARTGNLKLVPMHIYKVKMVQQDVSSSSLHSQPVLRSKTRSHPPGHTKRHHRTATPEQRQIRHIMKAPVYTIGIGPQADRGLLCDFFEAIATWAATYTLNPLTLSAPQIHALSTHPALTSAFGAPPQITMLLSQQNMLAAMLTSILTHFLFTRTMDAHALYLSSHAHGSLTSQLAHEWSALAPTDYAAKQALLESQRNVYAAIKALPGHRVWRATCAEYFSRSLVASLAALLDSSLAAGAVGLRDHLLQELFVKGYRIGFRLRMEAVGWGCRWPVAGEVFSGKTMVNESRMLYGDVLGTMERISREEGLHRVLFAVSPTMFKREVGRGEEREEVVHMACVHVVRREGREHSPGSGREAQECDYDPAGNTTSSNSPCPPNLLNHPSLSSPSNNIPRPHHSSQ
ncbi:hypothetical protein BDU57DRAFT_578804 [Ampelomyces quisqualis]|uniref:Uncharacterized protein n=1 Tax=Ampelomyces quisqualis TaxID=50730 RepID=A0A6A5QKB5_AMPQU|nr:hypothetical protein BDU57DRAFT_578804 [Ampelomyces quisqualis]